MFLRYEPSVANIPLTAARSNAAPVDGEAPARAHPHAEADALEQRSRQGGSGLGAGPLGKPGKAACCRRESLLSGGGSGRQLSEAQHHHDNLPLERDCPLSHGVRWRKG